MIATPYNTTNSPECDTYIKFLEEMKTLSKEPREVVIQGK